MYFAEDIFLDRFIYYLSGKCCIYYPLFNIQLLHDY